MQKVLTFSLNELQAVVAALVNLGNDTGKEAKDLGGDKGEALNKKAREYFSIANEIGYYAKFGGLGESSGVQATLSFDAAELRDIAKALTAESHRAEHSAYLAHLSEEIAGTEDARKAEQGKQALFAAQAREFLSMAETIDIYLRYDYAAEQEGQNANTR